MIVATLVLLALTAVAATVPAGTGIRRWLPTVAASSLLAAAAVLATVAGPAYGLGHAVGVVLSVVAAALGGTAMVPTVFRIARRRRRRDSTGDDPVEPLRGGLTIGILERVAVAVSILAGWPEGIAIVLAVKGLARYPELRESHASEQFIIGTFASVLWALAAAGVGTALIN
ncbi:hypothetical protein AYK61_04045 [Rhodococcus sp. SBT000017]|uniref:hypothetical protein n=1 Tax=Rhodococcus sp. SBT000017 TaxID=1803385 RepID=UPI000EF88AD8|nr:hypothetical protein [Rhodococcus sp. SBT000017]RMB75872.1 hypothetical protein AYK61_04045 [Rhodococcus sp. SBT000017]